ncbi:hypothetical protein ACQWHU_24340, partial [Salmonella enterica subsp. enterica serovar Infantis]
GGRLVRQGFDGCGGVGYDREGCCAVGWVDGGVGRVFVGVWGVLIFLSGEKNYKRVFYFLGLVCFFRFCIFVLFICF